MTFKTFFGTDINYFDRQYYRPSTLGAYKPSQQPAPTVPKGSSQTATATNWVWENTLNYKFDLKTNHHFNILAGYTSQKNTTRANETDGTDFPNDGVQTVNAATITSGTATTSQWSLLSYLGRVQYNFDEKYFLSASIRGDGSSRFDANDRTSIGSYFPKYIWGLTNEFSYKDFDLSVSFQAVHGNQILNLQRRYLFNSEGNANQMAEDWNYWKSPTDPGDGKAMRANRVANANSEQISSFHVENGSFVRLRNLSLGYSLKSSWFHGTIKALRIYISGQNLHTWTKYTGYNPEVNARPDNPLSQGEDYGTYPLARTYTAGINLGF